MDVIATEGAPKAIGPYSQAETGSLVEGDFASQTRRVFENLKAILVAGGTGFDRVIKATVYLTDLANFTTMNEIYASYFGETKPARTTVGVSQLPKGGLVEIDVIALL